MFTKPAFPRSELYVENEGGGWSLLSFAILWVMMFLIPLTSCSAIAGTGSAATIPKLMLPWRPIITREAQFVYGINAPVAMFASQIMQESGGRADVTASDLGRGGAQFMDGTSKFISEKFPELGAPAPYNPNWAIRAQVRYDGWIRNMVKGKDDCHRWAAVLKGYNAGPGYVKQGQAKSPDPETWFGVTEYMTTKQSAINLEYSRTYPRKILFKHQPLFATWGGIVCLPNTYPEVKK